MMMKTSDWRYERKYLIQSTDQKSFFEQIKNWGFYEQYPQRQVNNIYFDTPDLQFYQQSINGHFDRIKVRLRWYGNDLQASQLEFKIKKGSLGRKEIFPIKSPNIEDLDQIKNQLTTNDYLQSIYVHLIEISTNNYQRYYFHHYLYPIRLTLDFDLSFNSILIQDKLVIEIKYSPEEKIEKEVTSICQHIPASLSQFSKYTFGVEQLK